MNTIYYLLEANAYLAAFYLLYVLAFRSQTHYQLNRAYLLLTSALAFAIPVLQLGFLKADTGASITIGNIDNDVPMVYILPAAQQAHVWTVTDYTLTLYAMVSLALLINLGFKIFKLIALSKQGTVRLIDGQQVIMVPAENAAFSFFNYLFINTQFAASAAVLDHEQVHIRQKHSWDIVYLELLKVINWFNPIVYLLQKSLKEVHEFIADEQAILHGTDPANYADFLICNAYGVPQTVLTNSFFNKNLLKRRIIMLYQKKSGKLARLKYLLALPLAGGLLCLSTLAFTSKTYGWVDVAPKTLAKTVKLAQPELNIADPDLLETKSEKATVRNKAIINTDKLIKYLHTHLNYSIIKVSGPKDAIGIELVKGKDGNVPRFEVTPFPRTPYSDANIKEVLRVLSPSSRWVPYFKNQSVVFRLDTGSRTPIVHFPPPTSAIVLPPATSQQNKNLVFTAVEKQPNYPGGMQAFEVFLAKNIKYPAKARANNIQGRVFVQFVVEPTGALSSIKIIRDPGYGIGAEATRVMKLSPKWTAGIQNGKKVRVEYTVPVNFSLAVAKASSLSPHSIKTTDSLIGSTAKPGPTVDRSTGTQDLNAFYHYLAVHIRYPTEARDKDIDGRVFVQFNVNDDKQIQNVKILRSVSGLFNAEVMRVVQNFKTLRDGKPGFNYALPIAFFVEHEAGNTTTPQNKPVSDVKALTNNYKADNGRIYLNEVVVISYATLAK